MASIDFLKQLFEEKRLRRANLTVRAFSRQIGISSGALSQIMSGKRPLTQKTAQRIAERLALSEIDQEKFLQDEKEYIHRRDLMKLETFNIVSSWEHFAILSLTKLPHHQANAQWISKYLGISKTSAKNAIERLLTLGLLKRVGKNKFVQTGKPIITEQDVPSTALKKHHQSVLTRAEDALFAVPVDLREFASFTLATHQASLPKLKKMIRQFCHQFASTSESQKADHVYHLALQFFPAYKKGETP